MKKVTTAVWVLAVLLIANATFGYTAPDSAKKAEKTSVSMPAAKIDINKAGLEELEAIKGVGPALAERIITYRNENGGKFKTVEDLTNVKGIGQAKFERIKEQVIV